MWLFHSYRPDRGVYLFKGVTGPAAPSPVADVRGARPDDFAGGSAGRLAVLVTDTDPGWLGLARGLRAHGTPFTMTTKIAER